MRMAITCPPDFNVRLSAALIARRVKHEDLAKRIGVGRSYVTLMCSGKRRPAKPVALCMERELGPIVWAYIMGKADRLPTFAE